MMTDLNTIKLTQQQVWPTGDYQRVINAMNLMSMSEALCDDVYVLPHHRVLDVATGTGNTALAAARRGFPSVTGVDFAPELLEIAKERARTEGLDIAFDVGDAEELPYPDDSFDIALSTCGVMFAPDQEKAASELVRVCRPGGRIGVSAWTPDGAIGQFNMTIAKYAPPPPNLPSPTLWGSEDHVKHLFGERVEIRTEQRELKARTVSPKSYVETLMSHFGPAIAAKNKLDPDEQQSLVEEITAVISGFARPVESSFEIPETYLQTVGTIR